MAKSNLRPRLIGQTSYPCGLFVVRVGRYRLTHYREGEGRADDNAADVTAGIVTLPSDPYGPGRLDADQRSVDGDEVCQHQRNSFGWHDPRSAAQQFTWLILSIRSDVSRLAPLDSPLANSSITQMSEIVEAPSAVPTAPIEPCRRCALTKRRSFNARLV